MRGRIRTLLALAAVVVAVPAAAHAQGPATITGRVTNETGTPVNGVSVYLEGLKLGSVTDEAGRYTIVVPEARVTNAPATLTARLIGFRPLSRTVTLASGSNSVDFALAATPITLSEVVVTGAGLTSTREASGSVTNTVKADAIARSNESNVVSALAAKAPNVYVSSQSGEPGASSYISIRGAKTITGTGQPLFVVDGVPIDNSTNSTTGFLGGTAASNRAADINTNDIESVEVLKGAAAGAIYGSRAGQGVVLITTKSGHGPARYSLNSNSTWDEVSHGVPLQTKFGQRPSTTCPVTTTPGCRYNSDSYGPALAAGTATYDHFDEMFRTGHTYDNQLSVSGGTDRQSFYLSGGRTNQTGTIVGPNSFYDRSTFLVKASQKVMNKLTVGGVANYTDVRMGAIQKGSNISGLLLGALRSPPEFNNANYLNKDGYHRSYRYPNPIGASDLTLTRGYDNPFFVVNEDPARSDVNRVFGNVNLNYDALDWLNFRYTLGGDYSADDRLEALVPSSSAYPTGQMTRADYLNYQIDHNLLATARHSLTDQINATLTLGQNLNSRSYRQRYSTGYNFVAPSGPFNLGNTITVTPNEYESLVHLESYFGQTNLDLYDQLFLSATLRNDGNSTFAESQRRFWYPKASAAWTFTKATDALSSFLEYGKARVAYGQTGKEPPVYAIYSGYSFGSTNDEGWGGLLRTIQNSRGGMTSQSRLAQDNIRPERQNELEGGFDFGFRNGLGDISLTAYNSKSTDVIFDTPRSPSSGTTSQLKNAATISNKGLELSLNINPVRMENVGWDVGVQWSRNKNVVTSLSGVDHVDIGGAFEGTPGTVKQGYAVGVFRGNDFVRCRYGQTNMADLTGSGTVVDVNAACRAAGAPNGAVYIDTDGLPIQDPTDRVLADPNPKWLGSVRSEITVFKKWRIAGLLDIKKGGDVWNGTKGALYQFGTHRDTEVRNKDVVYGKTYRPGPVFGPGAGQTVQLTRTNWWQGLGSGFGPVASQFMEDGSYVKLREISLGYTLDQAFIKDLGLSTIDVRVAGRNLHTWTKYTGIDPETNLAGAESLLRGVDYFNNPQTRSVVLTVGLNR